MLYANYLTGTNFEVDPNDICEKMDNIQEQLSEKVHEPESIETNDVRWEVYYGKILEGFPHMEEFETEKEAKDFIYEQTGGDGGVFEDHIYMNFEENMEYYYVRSNFEEEEEYYYDDFGDEHSIWDYNYHAAYNKETRDYWHQAAQKGV